MIRNVYTFCAGPCILPLNIQEKAQQEFLNYKGTGIGICELNHRSALYAELNQHLMDGIRKLLNVPANYQILLTQGGSTTMNSAIPLNLTKQGDSANYLVTGLWGANSYKESKKFIESHQINSLDGFTRLPKKEEWKNFNPNGKYFYYTDNETVDGLEFKTEPEVDQILVCDMTSSLGTKKIDISKYGIIFGSVQKNLGPSGCCIAIIREDLIGHERADCPQMLSWAENLKMKSIVNTPPVFNTYMTDVMIWHLIETGGIEYYYEQSLIRQKLIYDVIDNSEGFYRPRVSDVDSRSRLNIVFYTDHDAEFIQEAASHGLIELKGHPSTGGIRVSMYNGLPMDGVVKLRDFMVEFRNKRK